MALTSGKLHDCVWDEPQVGNCEISCGMASTRGDRLRVGWLNFFHSSHPEGHGEGFRESKKCSKDTYPESYITDYTLVYEEKLHDCV